MPQGQFRAEQSNAVGWKQQKVVPLRFDLSPQGKLQVMLSLFLPPHSFACNHCCLPVLIVSFSLCYTPNGRTKLPGTAEMSCTGVLANFGNTVAFGIHSVHTIVHGNGRSNMPDATEPFKSNRNMGRNPLKNWRGGGVGRAQLVITGVTSLASLKLLLT